MSRPKGRKNSKPTREAIQNYYRMLAEAADQGDTSAARHLIELDLLNQSRTQRQESTQ